MKSNKYLILIISSLIILASCTAQSAQEKELISSKNQKTIIDNFSRELSNNYIFPDTAKIIATKIDSAFKAGYFKNSTKNADFADKITGFIRSLVQDNHLGIKYKPNYEIGNPREPRPQIIKREGAPENGQGGSGPVIEMREPVEFKILENNIGYLRLDMFDEQPIFNSKVDEAFQKAANTKAVIIDLRANGGGSPRAMAYVASYLLKQGTQLSSIFLRIDSNNIEEKFYTEPIKGKSYTAKPVYLLTGKRTFSAAENFSYDLQVQKRVTIVGVNTKGGAHPGREFSLGDSFFAFIPFGRSYNHTTKSNWESVGIKPDVLVDEKDALSKAISLIEGK